MSERSDGQEAPVAVLDDLEVRVLGVLAEKERLTPDAYPLSLNALTAGCNQLTSRHPVMQASDQDVREALARLGEMRLVSEVGQAGARVPKYEHRMRIAWLLEQDRLAVMATLMLRGPQTAGEIRGRTGKMHEFASIADVESALQFLMDKFPPLVARLPREQGNKESRYCHLLSGESVAQEDVQSGERAAVRSGSGANARNDKERIAALEAEVTDLRARMDDIVRQFEEFRKQFD